MAVIHGGSDSDKEHQSVRNGVNDLPQLTDLVETSRDVSIDPVGERQETKKPTSSDNAIVRHQAHIRRQHGQSHQRNQVGYRKHGTPSENRFPSHRFTLVSITFTTVTRHSLHL